MEECAGLENQFAFNNPRSLSRICSAERGEREPGPRKSALGLDALSADKTPTFRPRFAYEWRPRSTIQCVPVNDRIQRPSMRPFNRVRRTCRSPSSNLRTANTFQTLLQTEKWDKKFGTIGNALVEQREWKQRFRTTILSFFISELKKFGRLIWNYRILKFLPLCPQID